MGRLGGYYMERERSVVRTVPTGHLTRKAGFRDATQA
jgi:hypothetical protein